LHSKSTEIIGVVVGLIGKIIGNEHAAAAGAWSYVRSVAAEG